MEDQRTSSYLYAQEYSRLPKDGTRYLTFRDVPHLVKTFVDGTKTLDYGCGPGHSTIFLKSLGLDVEGVDINEHMISLSKQSDPEGRYTVINSGQIPTEDEKYDLVYAGFVLPYVSTKNEIVAIAKDIARVLKEKGTFIALVANSESYYKHKWLVEKTNFEENKFPISGSIKKAKLKDLTLYHYYWSDEDYRDAISQAGLTLVCTHRPLGKDSDGYPWIDEKIAAPSTIYVSRKLSVL